MWCPPVSGPCWVRCFVVYRATIAFFSIVEVGGFPFLEARSVATTQRGVIQWVLRGRSKVKKGAMMATLVSELHNQNSKHNIFFMYSFMCISLYTIKGAGDAYPYSSTSTVGCRLIFASLTRSSITKSRKFRCFGPPRPTNFQDLPVQQDDGLLFKRRFFNQFLLLFLNCSLHHVFLEVVDGVSFKPIKFA